MVHLLLSELFGKAPRGGVHPDEAVALGAAIQGGLKSGAISTE
jgi:molecular chaperone DnaK